MYLSDSPVNIYLQQIVYRGGRQGFDFDNVFFEELNLGWMNNMIYNSSGMCVNV